MTDDQDDTLGTVFDAVIAGMTTEQFEQLKRRTGHTEPEPK